MLWSVLGCIAVCAVTVGWNFLYALYQNAAVRGEAKRAAWIDTALFYIGAASFGAWFLIGWWVVIPEGVANWFGTYLGTRWASRDRR